MTFEVFSDSDSIVPENLAIINSPVKVGKFYTKEFFKQFPNDKISKPKTDLKCFTNFNNLQKININKLPSLKWCGPLRKRTKYEEKCQFVNSSSFYKSLNDSKSILLNKPFDGKCQVSLKTIQPLPNSFAIALEYTNHTISDQDLKKLDDKIYGKNCFIGNIQNSKPDTTKNEPIQMDDSTNEKSMEIKPNLFSSDDESDDVISKSKRKIESDSESEIEASSSIKDHSSDDTFSEKETISDDEDFGQVEKVTEGKIKKKRMKKNNVDKSDDKKTEKDEILQKPVETDQMVDKKDLESQPKSNWTVFENTEPKELKPEKPEKKKAETAKEKPEKKKPETPKEKRKISMPKYFIPSDLNTWSKATSITVDDKKEDQLQKNVKNIVNINLNNNNKVEKKTEPKRRDSTENVEKTPEKIEKIVEKKKKKNKGIVYQPEITRICTYCKKEIDKNWPWKNLCSYDCMAEITDIEYEKFYDCLEPSDLDSKTSVDIHMYLQQQYDECKT